MTNEMEHFTFDELEQIVVRIPETFPLSCIQIDAFVEYERRLRLFEERGMRAFRQIAKQAHVAGHQ